MISKKFDDSPFGFKFNIYWLISFPAPVILTLIGVLFMVNAQPLYSHAPLKILVNFIAPVSNELNIAVSVFRNFSLRKIKQTSFFIWCDLGLLRY